jgi:hypothetical protein
MQTSLTAVHHWYHFNGMRPQTIGRALGIGVRVAGRMAGQRLAGGHQSQQAQPQPAAPPVTYASSSGSRRKTGNLRRGLAGFFKPFTRIGGIVFLEVTGVFFLIFVLVFGQMAWRARTNYATGPDHSKFLAAAALSLVFLYLSVTSFWRARKR